MRLFQLTISLLLLACGQSSQNQGVTPTTTVTGISIDTFSEFPPEIDGCSCYFSNDSNDFKSRVYIYMSNYERTAFLKINGVLIKFTKIDGQDDSKGMTLNHYKSGSYDLRIEIKDGPQSGEETGLKTGNIELTNQAGKTIKKTFYGECGC